MRTSVRSRRPCRMISWPAANGIRCVNPSRATVSPSSTSAAIASSAGRSARVDGSLKVFGKRTDVLKTNHTSCPRRGQPSTAGTALGVRGEPVARLTHASGLVIESRHEAPGRAGRAERPRRRQPDGRLDDDEDRRQSAEQRPAARDGSGSGRWRAELESAGFESLWVSDHIVLPETIESRYPFAEDGRATWATDTPYFDALIALALIAEATERATIGTAVLVLPLRQPVVFAKQAASIDVASGGRLRARRRRRLARGGVRRAQRALRRPGQAPRRVDRAHPCLLDGRARRASTSELYDLPAGVLCLPRPAHRVPLLSAATRGVALRRAGRIGRRLARAAGAAGAGPGGAGRAAIETMRAAAAEAGATPHRSRSCCGSSSRPARSEELAPRLRELAAAGVDEIIVDVSLENGEAPEVYARLQEAAA